jgi:hypothetical protein
MKEQQGTVEQYSPRSTKDPNKARQACDEPSF